MADQLEQQIERALDQVKSGPAAIKPIGSNGPIVLFGAGRLGLIALKGLRRIGIEPVAWADNNPRLHGTVVQGLTVYSATEAAAKFGEATFVVTIYTGAGVRRQLSEMGLRAIACTHVFRQYPDTFLPHGCLDLPSKLLPHRQDILRAAKIWADDASRAEYLAQIRYRALLDEAVPPAHPGPMYFPGDLFKLTADEGRARRRSTSLLGGIIPLIYFHLVLRWNVRLRFSRVGVKYASGYCRRWGYQIVLS